MVKHVEPGMDWGNCGVGRQCMRVLERKKNVIRANEDVQLEGQTLAQVQVSRQSAHNKTACQSERWQQQGQSLTCTRIHERGVSASIQAIQAASSELSGLTISTDDNSSYIIRHLPSRDITDIFPHLDFSNRKFPNIAFFHQQPSGP